MIAVRLGSGAAAALLGLMAATAVGCNGAVVETTGLVVEVRASGLTAGVDLDELVVTIGSDPPAKFALAAQASGDKVTLPFRFSVLPRNSATETVTINVVGRRGGASKVSSSAQVGFIKNELRLLVIVLYSVCVDKTPACLLANRCVASAADATRPACEPNKVEVKNLPPFVVPDGGLDGGGGKGGGGGSGGGSVDGGDDQAAPVDTADAPPGNDTADAPGDGLPPGCMLNATRCAAAGGFVETCSGDGAWIKKMDCPNLCQSGACTGSCKPDTKHCAGQTPETCSPAGAWEPKTACAASACVDGACIGGCVPGGKRCGVANPKQPELCDATGNWVAMGAACASVCSSGSCSGSCPPGMLRCGASETPELCSVQGTWEPQIPCQWACTGAGACTGECKPLTRSCDPVNTDHARVCSPAGIWQDLGACDNACTTGGNCTGVCKPMKRECDPASIDHPRVCSAAGFWQDQGACQAICTGAGACTGECKTGQKDCQGVVGGTPRVCDVAGHWMARTACDNLCDAGACTGECRPGATGCLGKQARVCDGSGVWRVQTTCTFACQEPAGTCTTCDPGITKRCNSGLTNLQLCKTDGSGYQDWTACPNGCNGARLECNSCQPGNVVCDLGASTKCKTDGSGYAALSSCDKQCGYGLCPVTGGTCREMKDIYVVNVRKPSYAFCEIHDAAYPFGRPVEDTRCEFDGGEAYVYTRTGDIWVPEDNQYWICAGQGGSRNWHPIPIE